MALPHLSLPLTSQPIERWVTLPPQLLPPQKDKQSCHIFHLPPYPNHSRRLSSGTAGKKTRDGTILPFQPPTFHSPFPAKAAHIPHSLPWISHVTNSRLSVFSHIYICAWVSLLPWCVSQPFECRSSTVNSLFSIFHCRDSEHHFWLESESTCVHLCFNFQTYTQFWSDTFA